MIAYNDPHTRYDCMCVLVLRPVVEAVLGGWHSLQGTCTCVLILILRSTLFVSSTACSSCSMCFHPRTAYLYMWPQLHAPTVVCVLIMHSCCMCPHTTCNCFGVLIMHSSCMCPHTACNCFGVLILHATVCVLILHTTIYVFS